MVRPTADDPKSAAAPSSVLKKARKNPNPTKKYRFKPGTCAVRQMRRLQNSVATLSARKPYEDIVRNMDFVREGEFKFSKEAWKAIQCASEAFLTDRFKRAVLVQIAAKAQTLTKTHMRTTEAILKNAVPE